MRNIKYSSKVIANNIKNFNAQIFNIYLFFFCYAALSLIIVYKVINVPITHDETATTVHYAAFSVWEIMMYPDPWPNNHILNTILTKLLISVFGKEQWVVRIPNLLSFLIFSIAVFRILRLVVKSNSVFFFPAAVIFISNPYLLDFFGLSRGYGISIALVTLSVSYILSAWRQNKLTHIWLALLWATLASYANFTVLVFWVATIINCGLFFLSQLNRSSVKWSMLALLLILLSYLALIAIPIYKMQSTNQFEYWTSQGFYRETIYSLVEHWRYHAHLLVKPNPHLIAFLGIGLVGFSLWRCFQLSRNRTHFYRSPLVLTTLLLCLTAGISYVQSKVLETPNLSGRTALFFYPLFSAMVVCLLADVAFLYGKKTKRIIAFTIVFLGIWHLVDRVKLDSVKEWRSEKHTFEVLDYLEDKKQNERPIILQTSWQFHPTFRFYEATGKVPWLILEPYSKSLSFTKDVNYFYLSANEFDQIASEFEVIQEYDSQTILAKRK